MLRRRCAHARAGEGVKGEETEEETAEDGGCHVSEAGAVASPCLSVSQRVPRGPSLPLTPPSAALHAARCRPLPPLPVPSRPHLRPRPPAAASSASSSGAAPPVLPLVPPARGRSP
ncbi:Hypothetical predicted protein [Podarcis lilfordi]|uniref:Uncharacterized protein n=1 Tax=Podarcis lilfordi TaxID=74358 RepID=A0AA35PKD0_9SAUR|nr:Hypothetical predicted protein [Podarcis lilfordi]